MSRNTNQGNKKRCDNKCHTRIDPKTLGFRTLPAGTPDLLESTRVGALFTAVFRTVGKPCVDCCYTYTQFARDPPPGHALAPPTGKGSTIATAGRP